WRVEMPCVVISPDTERETQAVVQACNGDWDQAITMSPGVDFEEGFVGHYSALNHRVGGQGFGTIYFVRMLDPAKSEENPAPQ
ncbi:MAG: hypothetical protein P8X49_14050, partial [Syntrophobacterales bacterium]